MIIWKKHGIRVADYFFDEEPAPVQADVIRYHQWSSAVPGSRWTPFHTLLIDLRKPAEEIYAGMEPDCRKEIRRAESKDTLLYFHCSDGSSSVCREVCELHDAFAAQKGLPKTNRRRIAALAGAHLLDISLFRNPRGDVLVWRIYYRDSRRARNLLNGSLYRTAAKSAQRQLIGRAHRYLVWRDILRFQEAGLETYDFGGWYMGREDKEKLRINQFKKEFGGYISESFNCARGVKWPGKLALSLLRLKDLLSPVNERGKGKNALDVRFPVGATPPSRHPSLF